MLQVPPCIVGPPLGGIADCAAPGLLFDSLAANDRRHADLTTTHGETVKKTQCFGADDGPLDNDGVVVPISPCRGNDAATVRKDRPMAQQSQIGKHATTISRLDGKTIVTYHDTPVVTVDPDGTVTLNSGGWRSATTKTRMNQAASQLNLSFSVQQRDFEWRVSVDGPGAVPPEKRLASSCMTIPFADGMKFRVYQDARRVA